MKKFLLAGAATCIALSMTLPVLAKGSVAVDSTCMQTAVAKRESAVLSSFDTYYTTLKTALQTRKDALNTAWGMSDATARNAAIQAAHSAFNGTWRQTSSALKAARKDAWKTFRLDAKGCKTSPSVEDSAAVSDAQM